jgi:predicted glutamate--cysteine ligase
VLSLLRHPAGLDPLQESALSARELADLCDANEAAAARQSLEAELRHWRDGRTIRCSDWIQALLADVTPLAEELNLRQRLQPIDTLLQEGNQAMRWLKAIRSGASLRDVMREGIAAMAAEELSMSSRTGALG